jgi:hypothetical protein
MTSVSWCSHRTTYRGLGEGLQLCLAGNVVFEAALFIAKHGRDRCFIVQPRNHPAFDSLRDLDGITPATYDERHYRENPQAALGPACHAISNAIEDSASFKRTVSIVPKLELADPATSGFMYPKKLAFRITNPEASAVLVTSRYFEMAGRLKGHAGQYLGSKHQFKVPFLAYTDKSRKDVYRIEHFLKPSESVRAWLALDSNTEDEAARDALAKSQVGTWRITCHWIDEPMERRQYDFEF